MKKHRKCKKIIAFVTVLFIAFVAVIGLHKTGKEPRLSSAVFKGVPGEKS